MRSDFGGLDEIPEDWQYRSLDEIGLIIGGGTPDSTKEEYWEGGIPWAVPTDITSLNGKFVRDTERHITQIGLECSAARILPPHSVLITSRATIGECAVNEVPMATNQGFQSLVCNSANDYQFMFYAIKFHKAKLLRLAYGTTFLEIKKSNMKRIRIPCPKLAEQQQIGSILSKVDDLIHKTDEIIEQTQRLKKGLMQTLLTKGIGHTKFKKVKWYYAKEIEIPDCWQVVFLDDVAKRGSGHTPDVKKPEYYDGGIKWVSLADSNKLDNLCIAETSKEISEEGIRNSSAVMHPTGTVIMSRDAGIGKSAILLSEMAVSQHFIAWQCSEKLDNHFLYFTLQFRKAFFESIANGTTIKTIGLPFFKKLRICLPPIEEQRKIARIMIDFEKQIDHHSYYLSLYNNLKKRLDAKTSNR